MMRGVWIGLATAMSITACQSLAKPAQDRPAALKSVDDPAIRESIRLYVRDTLGEEYIADLEKLTSDGTVMATDRGRSTVTGQALTNAPVTFYVFQRSDGTKERCVLDWTDNETAPLDLPRELCVPLDPDIQR